MGLGGNRKTWMALRGRVPRRAYSILMPAQLCIVFQILMNKSLAWGVISSLKRIATILWCLGISVVWVCK